MFLLKCNLHTSAQKFWPHLKINLILPWAYAWHLIRLGIENESDFTIIADPDSMRGILPVIGGYGKLSQWVSNGIHNQSLFRHFLACMLCHTRCHRGWPHSPWVLPAVSWTLYTHLDSIYSSGISMVCSLPFICRICLLPSISWNRPGVSSNGLHGPSN